MVKVKKKTTSKKAGTSSTAKSTTGTVCTDNDKNFGYKAICAIIKTCRDAGVSKLSFGGLEVEFGVGSPSPSPSSTDSIPAPTIENIDLPETKENGASVALMTEEQKDHMRDLELSRLMMDNPLEYENQLINDMLAE